MIQFLFRNTRMEGCGMSNECTVCACVLGTGETQHHNCNFCYWRSVLGIPPPLIFSFLHLMWSYDLARIPQLDLSLEIWSCFLGPLNLYQIPQGMETLESRSEHTAWIDFAKGTLLPWQPPGYHSALRRREGKWGREKGRLEGVEIEAGGEEKGE